MAVTNGVVVWPVEIADIQRVAGVVLQRTVGGVTQRKISGEIGVLASAVEGDTIPDDAGGTAWTVVSRIPINVWAKYKPVRFSYLDTTHNPSDPTETWLNSNKSWKTDAYVIWWRNPQNVYGETIYTCGFAIPASAGISENIADNLGAWQYLRPRGEGSEGGVSYYEPKRFLDFNQYLPSAKCPFEVKLPSIAVLSNGTLHGKCRFMVPSVHTYNLTLNDIFGQAGGDMYFGVAVVIGTAVWSRTQAYGNERLISLEGLENKVSVNQVVTLVAFATRHAHATWSDGSYQVYSLDAPGIDFNVIQQCKIVQQPQTSYSIAFSGLEFIDKACMRTEAATETSGRVSAVIKPASRTLSNTYNLTTIRGDVYLVDINGDSTLIDTQYFNPNDLSSPIRPVSPVYIEKNNYGSSYQLYCQDAMGYGQPTEVTSHYNITYTFIYEKE